MKLYQHARSVFALCIRPRRRLFLQTMVVVLIFNAIDLLLPKFLQLFVDSLDEGLPLRFWGVSLAVLQSPTGRLLWFPLMLTVLALVRWLFTYLRGVGQARLGQGAMEDLRNRIYDQIQNLSFAYHDREHSGRLISNLVEDIGAVQRFFERSFMALLEVGFGFICIYFYMASVCWPAAAASLALVMAAWSTGLLYFRYGYPYFQRRRQLFEKVVTTFSETMEGHLVVRAFGNAQEQRQVYNRQVTDLHKAQFIEMTLFSLLNQCYLMAVVGGVALVAGVMVVLIRHGWNITSGEFFVVLYLQNFMIMRMRWLSRVTEQWMRFSVASERLSGVLDADDYLADASEALSPAPTCQTVAQGATEASTCCQAQPAILPHGSIAIEDLTFGYGDAPRSLSRISLSIEEGSTVGLIGATGSGKTTLALLLCRFYDPASGCIRLGDTDVRSIPVALLRRQFALVFQDTFLFSASIRDNIAYGKPCATLEDVVHVATLAHAHDFVTSFPQGYETRVGERGVTLSGGQRQRIALARAMLREPRFLILDDATSSLDTQTESLIQESLRSLPQTTTRIVIAHRYSSVADADQVFVLDRGQIVEQGTPQSLRHPGTRFSQILQLGAP